MSKLPNRYQFLDLSDYGRSIAYRIALIFKDTTVTPIQVTIWFIISGVIAIFCIIYNYHFAAAFFLILKSILDAADGELSRLKNTPSYVGRYFDSIADIILNFLFLLAIWYITDGSFLYLVLAFIGVQLQGTLYNYYYVILRQSVDGDSTSRVFENSTPKAMPGESQAQVDLFYKIFNSLYIIFDKSIYYLDKQAIDSKPFPKWFMTMVSSFGLGFQLLIMGFMLILNLEYYIIPFFIAYSTLILVYIGIRKTILK